MKIKKILSVFLSVCIIVSCMVGFMTPFGKSVLNKQEYYYKALTCPEEDHIGYEGSPSVLNTVGLTTVMTAKKNIVTNLYRKVLPDNINIIIEKPRTTINDQNYRYLQLADIIISIRSGLHIQFCGTVFDFSPFIEVVSDLLLFDLFVLSHLFSLLSCFHCCGCS